MGPHTLVILGSGYTGRFLAAQARGQGRVVLSTSREPGRQLIYVPPAQRLRFNLARPDTWTSIPADADLIWCFPAMPLEQVQAFAKRLAAPSRRLVVLGSTSAYEVPSQSTDYPPPWIDETAPIDLSKPRVQGEEYLRKEHGAMVLRLAGIYGRGRNPLDWIRSGRVGSSRKYVNLIHVDDLATICLLALKEGTPGEVYNVTDGTPRTWEDICRVVQARWGVTAPKAEKDNRAGKRIKTIALRDKLGAVIRHPDLYGELEKLEEAQR
jgi:nucleoside-diphosphate-sugar epimerase